MQRSPQGNFKGISKVLYLKRQGEYTDANVLAPYTLHEF